ncbi:MAG TPA: GNAT family protein [Gaiellaceae bacterium]|nr:GNAT family protein [Gaiellaceae bacterium]
MDQTDAAAIAAWTYEPPYSFYDWTADADDLALLLDAETREGRFFSVDDENGDLVGFFEFRVEGPDVVVGLGLRPNLTGGGLGQRFVGAGLDFACERFAPAGCFRLSVATFNERAIRVYERCGFQPARTYDHATNGGVHRFMEMRRPV